MPQSRFVCVAFALAMAVVLLGGCVASKNLLGLQSKAVDEPRLLGTWIYDGEDKKSGFEYLHVFEEHPDGIALDIVALGHTGKGNWVAFDGYVTAIGKRRIVNLRVTAATYDIVGVIDKSGRKDSHPYHFAAIAFEGDDHLIVAFPIMALRTAVKDGRLAGEIVDDAAAFLSDDSTKIADYLGALDQVELFKDSRRYRRLALPP